MYSIVSLHDQQFCKYIIPQYCFPAKKDSLPVKEGKNRGVDTNLNNAYYIAKAMIQYKNLLTDSIDNPTTKTLKSRLLGALVWYANAQDYEEKEQLYQLFVAAENRPAIKGYLELILKTTFIDGANIYKQNNLDNLYDNIPVTSIKNEFKKLIADIQRKQKAIGKWKETVAENTRKLNDLQTKSQSKAGEIQMLQDSLNRKISAFANDAEKTGPDSSTKEITVKILDNISSLKIEKSGIDDDIKAKQDSINKHPDSLDIKTKERNASIDAYDTFIKKHPSELSSFFTKLKNLNLSALQHGGGQSPGEITEYSVKGESNINVIIQQQEQATNTIKLPSVPTQSEIIDALAIYLAKRVKQEMVMWFFETIRANASRHELITTLFPGTIALLQSQEVYEIPNLGTQWRYALSKDFVTLPANLAKSDWLGKRLSPDQKKYLPYLTATVEMADLLVQRYSYRDLVKSMYLKYNNGDSTSKDVANLFGLLYAVNTELNVKVNDTTARMLNYEDMKYMTKSELEIMLSLMDMKYGHCVEGITARVFDSLSLSNVSAEKVRTWLGCLEQAVEQFDKVRKEFNTLQKNLEKGQTKEVLYSTYNVWNFVSQLVEVAVPAGMPGIDPIYKEKMNKVVKYIKLTQEVYSQISNKNFAGAVNSSIQLLDELVFYNGSFRLGYIAIKKSVHQKDNTAGTQKDSLVLVIPINAESNLMTYYLNKMNEKADTSYLKELGCQLQKIGNTINVWVPATSQFAAAYYERERHAVVILRKLSGFLNDVALSDNSKTLARVVESYAMPPGSYKRKRNNWWSVDVTAMVGPYLAREWTEKKDDKRSSGYIYGLSAPLGLSISKTFGRRVKTAQLNQSFSKNPDKLKLKYHGINRRTLSTLTFTASIIDIGAVVSYRFNSTDQDVLPQQVKWLQVISPGFHLSYGLPKTPLVVSSGFQFAPELRRMDGEKYGERQLDTYRVYLGIYFDLPLLNVWERKSIVH